MGRVEALIRRTAAFLGSDVGKSTAGLFSAVVCFCWPAAVAYPTGAACLYYAIHQFRPVGLWIYNDIRADLNHPPTEEEEDVSADAGGY